jgi:3-methyladenine DNA glycosylase Tag
MTHIKPFKAFVDNGNLQKIIHESKESDALAKEIDKAMIKIDDSMSYKDFALAVGKILKDEYGSHNYKGFMEVLHKNLGI